MTQTRHAQRHCEAGISLVEVLVVLVIVSVMAGAIGLSFNRAGQGDSASREAQVIAARLTRASDEALLAGTPIAVVWSADAYRLLHHDGSEWRAFDIPLLAQTHVLPRGLRLETRSGSEALSSTDGPENSFTVGADLIPTSHSILTLAIVPDGGVGISVLYNGVQARIGDGT